MAKNKKIKKQKQNVKNQPGTSAEIKHIIRTAKNNKDFFNKLVEAKNVEGLYQIAGQLPNPDSVLKKTGKGIEILKSLKKEGQVATCITSRKAGVLSLNWQIECAKDDRKEFYETLLKSIDIRSLVSNILNAPLYGFQPLEIIWKNDIENGVVIPKEITAPPVKWFHYNTDNELCFKAKGYKDGLVIDFDEMKFLCPKHEADEENPYGEAVLSLCLWDIAFKKGGYEFWAKFMEKYSMPYFVGKYDESANEDDITKLLNDLVAMVQDACIVIPNNSSVEIKEAAGKSASFAIYKEFIKLCDENISKNILGQTLTTDSGDKGSYALGNVHARVREDIIESDKRLVEKTINELLSYIHQINFDDEDIPEFNLYGENDIKKELAERDKILSEIGVKFKKLYFQKAYNLEEDDFELASPRVQFEANNFSETAQFEPQNNLDVLNDYMCNNEVDKILNNSIKPIIEAFKEEQNTDAALEKLSEIYPKMDFKELEETLAKVIFISNLWGRATANKDRATEDAQ